MDQLYKLVKEYLDFLKYQKNYSELTIQGYQREIDHFIAFLKKKV